MIVRHINCSFVMIVQKFDSDDYRNVRFLEGPKLVRYGHALFLLYTFP